MNVAKIGVQQQLTPVKKTTLLPASDAKRDLQPVKVGADEKRYYHGSVEKINRTDLSLYKEVEQFADKQDINKMFRLSIYV